MKVNKELEIALDFVNQTDRNIFLTGKAGTGKTTFLHNLNIKPQKRIVVVAPTGVAAINAKGVTIHSFFQLPFGPILPDLEGNNFASLSNKFNKTKISIIKSMDLLIIDEISMVRADLLDGIDTVLRRFRNKNKVFGGVQLLMIGDLQQLSPVIKEEEYKILKPFYKSIYFFNSYAFKKCNAITIELKHIYRQDDACFIQILNEIRNNILTKSSTEALNKRFLPDFVPIDDEGYIRLTTHNSKAAKTNALELNKLNTQAYTYKAAIEGKFPESSFPNEEKLLLKVGAQVMFIKNDSSVDKLYFNGKIGKVIKLTNEEVIVKCPNDDFNIITKPETWDNKTYTIDKETNEISENKIGSFTQIPLRLAWAITIHKSQGLTFEKAIIDAQDAFAHGQTYVALSRCKSLEGLVLKSKIDKNQIINDSNVISFNKQSEANHPDENELLKSKSQFQLSLIFEIFDFFNFIYPIQRILDIFYKNRSSIEGNLETPLLKIKESITALLKVNSTFNLQLRSYLNDTAIEPEKNQIIQERFLKAITYYNNQTKSFINKPFKTLSFYTDNKAIEKDIEKQLAIIEEALSTKLFYFEGLLKGFNTHDFLKLRAQAVFLTKEKSKTTRNRVIDGTINIELFELLRELRNDIAEREGLIHFQIFTQKALYSICETLPTTTKELLNIKGMGKIRVQKYGEQILEVIKTYCIDNNIDSIESSNKNILNTKKKNNTKTISLNLFKSGKTINEIAKERELTISTIIGHLASFIEKGEIKITDLMPKSHYKELKEIIPKYTFENLSDLKHQIDEKYSYAELRLVLNELSNQ